VGFSVEEGAERLEDVLCRSIVRHVSNVKLGIWRPKLGIAAPLALGFVQTRRW
jgi:hypothetical protein